MALPKYLAFCNSLIIILLISGCALTDDKVELTYQPILSSTTQYPDSIVVHKFVDTRSNKQIVGEVRNLKGKRTADVVIGEQDPGIWISNALIAELKASGLTTVSSSNTDTNKTGNTVTIDGDIFELFITTNMDFKYRCTVRVSVHVTKNSVSLLKKDYVGKGEADADWGFDEERESAVRSSLQNLMERAVPEIIGVIDYD